MKKISIVIPCYGTEKYIRRCLDSIINQSYKNLEIIAVNDCSPGNMLDILEEYKKIDSRIKIVSNKTNKGLFKTRCIGSRYCTGDYISFIDSDDYIDIDFYRSSMNNLEENKSDIVVSNFAKVSIKDSQDTDIYVNNLIYNSNNVIYEGKQILDSYFEQKGENYRFHVIWNKLIDINVWKNAYETYKLLKERLVMTEDFIFSTIALYYAKKVSWCDEAVYFYCDNPTSSTSTDDVTIDKVKKNVNDIIASFNFVKNFLKKKKIYGKYKTSINDWESFYLSINMHTLTKLNINNEEKKKILDFVYKNDLNYEIYQENNKNNENKSNFYGMTTKWDDRLSELKKMIMSNDIDVVSFDMFDTLIWRPFALPSDMFKLINKSFRDEFKNIPMITFSKIRIDSENILRNINYAKGKEEITLDEIYKYIENKYKLDHNKLERIKKIEINSELNFCFRRQTAYQLYLLARMLGKKVIVTSDIYLSNVVINKILEKNGYKFDNIYISSDLLKTKNHGTLFEYVKEQEKTDKILHIGDNYHSDYENAKKHGISAVHFPKAYDVLMNSGYCGTLEKNFELFNQDMSVFTETFGVRCSLAIVANKYFDNPFRTFNIYSDFNTDPFLIGYYVVGMHCLSLSNWLLKDTKINKINTLAFMARDGYLPLKTTEILQNNTNLNKNLKLKYVYVSRKSLVPLVLKNKLGLSQMDHYYTAEFLTPNDIVNQFRMILNVPKDYKRKLKDEGYSINKRFDSVTSFNNCFDFIYENFFSEEKYEKYFEIVKEYFEDIYDGNSATFDIGYSGKPESIISFILNKNIKTYFVHANNSTGFENATLANYELKTFFDFKPTLTGTLRELIISDIGASCIGYKKDNDKVLPIFDKKEVYNVYNKDILKKLQSSAMDFVNDFSLIFKDYIDEIDLNRYYMSVPYEYFLHYGKNNDMFIFNNLMFDDNINNIISMKEFINNRFDEYNKYYNLACVNKIYITYDNIKLPKSRINRAIYYSLFDRDTYRKKINSYKNRVELPETLPNNRIKRILYYILFNKRFLIEKIKLKINKRNIH